MAFILHNGMHSLPRINSLYWYSNCAIATFNVTHCFTQSSSGDRNLTDVFYVSQDSMKFAFLPQEVAEAWFVNIGPLKLLNHRS